MRLVKGLLLLAALAAGLLPMSCAPAEPAEPPVYGFRVVNAYPHDPTAFTQGLCFVYGTLYESTGLLGQSTLRRVDLTTGAVQQEHRLAPDLFGEGIAVYGDEIVQLTWQSHIGFVYERQTFAPVRQFNYQTDGWGITWDGRHLIMSDGTAALYFLDPITFEVTGSVSVHTPDGLPVTGLNELEYVNGEVYANVWQTDRIVRFRPDSGLVTGWIDLSGLLEPQYRTQPVDVLNGIAYDAENDRLFVTGKLWPRLFEIELIQRVLQ